MLRLGLRAGRPAWGARELTRGLVSSVRLSRQETPAMADVSFLPDSQPLDSQHLPHESGTLTPSQLDAQVGDYPTLPQVSFQRRSEVDKWWDQQDRRNFGETLPEEDEALTVWAPDLPPTHTTPATALLQQGIFICCVLVFTGLIYTVGWKRQAVPREYPYDGLLRELSGTSSDEYKHLSARTMGQGKAEIEAAKEAAAKAAEEAEEED